eukprot:TRINITY_DN1198_c0_g2_i2.p1 TRINITY_DN1198_c0_g2~~TRINITY_DN1198_c0_g2_i2.p1  ORF type:complete len:226 (-),score=48.11 TRINITY_DN1198_c0_g2_i2:1807-2484(-)
MHANPYALSGFSTIPTEHETSEMRQTRPDHTMGSGHRRMGSDGSNSTTSSAPDATSSLPAGDWTMEELNILEENLAKLAGETQMPWATYVKIANQLPNKTIRDVALRIKLMDEAHSSRDSARNSLEKKDLIGRRRKGTEKSGPQSSVPKSKGKKKKTSTGDSVTPARDPAVILEESNKEVDLEKRLYETDVLVRKIFHFQNTGELRESGSLLEKLRNEIQALQTL